MRDGNEEGNEGQTTLNFFATPRDLYEITVV